MMWIKFIICIIFLCSIIATDIKEYKIRNKVVLPMVLIGIVLGLIEHSLKSSLLGMLLPLLLFPLYALHMLGAGDIKALCAIGSIVGLRASGLTLILTILSGGVIALGFLICRGGFLARMKYLWTYLKQCFLMKRLESYDFGGGQSGYFRFAYAIAAGTMLMFLNEWIHFI